MVVQHFTRPDVWSELSPDRPYVRALQCRTVHSLSIRQSCKRSFHVDIVAGDPRWLASILIISPSAGACGKIALAHGRPFEYQAKLQTVNLVLHSVSTRVSDARVPRVTLSTKQLARKLTACHIAACRCLRKDYCCRIAAPSSLKLSFNDSVSWGTRTCCRSVEALVDR